MLIVVTAHPRPWLRKNANLTQLYVVSESNDATNDPF